MRQTIAQLRPFKMDERISKRGIIEGGTNTERGTELDAIVELYTSPNFKPNELIARGVSSFLVVKKRGTSAEKSPSNSLPVTKTTVIRVAANQGRRYASCSGDYNPFHLYSFMAKLFGFKKAIAQGMWSASRAIGEMGDRFPKYPVRIELTWKRPIFMPSTIKLVERLSEDGTKLWFDLFSEDDQHHHLQGYAEHVPGLKLERA